MDVIFYSIITTVSMPMPATNFVRVCSILRVECFCPPQKRCACQKNGLACPIIFFECLKNENCMPEKRKCMPKNINACLHGACLKNVFFMPKKVFACQINI
jgi:hypothetical protein